MRLVVFSDSHGKTDNMRRIIAMNRNAECFLHLGDGSEEFMNLCASEGVLGMAVAGNCDGFFSSYPPEIFCEFGGKKIFMTHGHNYKVKWDDAMLISKAREKGADILLYGHTHVAVNLYNDDGEKPLYIINPGSVSKPSDFGEPSFATIEIRNSQILANIGRIG